MRNSMQMISTKVFMAAFLLLINSSPAFAQLYGVWVSKFENVSAPSPNKKWSVSVKYNKEELPMLTIQREPGGGSQELMGASIGYVLWSPDSKAFAFTDAEFYNHYFVHICSVEATGTVCHDLTTEIESRVERNLSAKTEVDRLYAKAMKWQSPSTLIVGVFMVTSPEMEPGQTSAPVYYSYRAFFVDANTGRITKELSKKQARHELGANLDQLWKSD